MLTVSVMKTNHKRLKKKTNTLNNDVKNINIAKGLNTVEWSFKGCSNSTYSLKITTESVLPLIITYKELCALYFTYNL